VINLPARIVYTNCIERIAVAKPAVSKKTNNNVSQNIKIINQIDKVNVDNLITNHLSYDIVVIDTCVLLADPNSIFSFNDLDVVIPLTVLEELDKHKSRLDDIGRSARQSVRNLEKLRVQAGGDLTDGLLLDNGSRIRIVINGIKHQLLRDLGLDVDQNDNRILGAALGLRSEKNVVTVVSIDVNMRIKAASLGLQASDWTQGISRDTYLQKGWSELELSAEQLDQFHLKKSITLVDIMQNDILEENEFAVLKAGKQSALARRKGEELKSFARQNPWGLTARSKEQSFALELLMDPTIPLVALSGQAGTGKTIIAIAAALAQVFEPSSAKYDRLTIIRPFYAVGRQEIGFLPGTLEEKIGPWFESIVDTMVALGDRVTHAQAARNLESWVVQGRLSMMPVTFLRGRSLQRNMIIVDEAQNLEAPLTLKTILTRVGEGSKLVMLGDITQIDNSYVGEESNALSVLVDRFRGQELFGHVKLNRGERSELANLAAELL